MKKAVLIILPILIILAFGGGFLVLKNGGQKTQAPVVMPTPTVEAIPIQSLTQTNPYGVDLTPRLDKKAVFLKISSFPQGVKTIEYEITYDAREGPRGVLGTIDYKGEGKIKREILLGTCSKNVCRYDEGVTTVTLSLVFRGDKTEKFQETFSLESGKE